MKFTRQNFIDYVFQPYNMAVKRGEYEKIDYGTWRVIRDWAYDETWSSHNMEIEELNEGYSVGLYHQLRTCPAPMYIEKSDNAYGSWIGNHRMEIMMWDIDVQATLSKPVNYYDTKCVNNLTIGSDSNTSINFECRSDNFYIDGVSIDDHIKKLINAINVKEKENKNMKFANFDFGPVDSSIRMSLYGMAIKNASGTYVAYDATSKQVMDVDIFNFEGANKFIYKMPVAIKDISVGDVVIHARKPMFVQEVKGENRLNVLDIFDGEEKTVVLTKSPFGFDFITKVVSLIDMTGSATAGNPFGNMLPFLLMGDSKNSEDFLPLMLMSQSGSSFASNPMLMYALMSKDGKASDILPLMLLMGNCANPVQPTGCNGTCTCHKETGSAK